MSVEIDVSGPAMVVGMVVLFLFTIGVLLYTTKRRKTNIFLGLVGFGFILFTGFVLGSVLLLNPIDFTSWVDPLKAFIYEYLTILVLVMALTTAYLYTAGVRTEYTTRTP